MDILEIEAKASTSNATLEEFTDSLWNFLLINKKEGYKLGKSLEVFNYKNPGNVFREVMLRLTEGVCDERFK